MEAFGRLVIVAPLKGGLGRSCEPAGGDTSAAGGELIEGIACSRLPLVQSGPHDDESET